MDTPNSNNPRRVLDDVLSPHGQQVYQRAVQSLHAREYARQVGSETRLLGLMFGIVGVVLAYFAWESREGQLLQIANTVALVGPGVWYVFAARYLQHGRTWVVPITFKVALGQGAVVIFLLMLGQRLGFARRGTEFIIPAILAIYFCPALAVLCWKLRKVAGVAPLLNDEQGRAFEPLRVQPVQQPVDEKGGSDGTSAQG